ncbi:hypothetical protein KSP35_04720 [Aquihabitans sp. G128]|uniref:sensor histidine kinase n=1 Tax=Aquihabitans sp. G128 TaxID=2849779 RepID=UPI001C227F99|nr:ATP-binding protein [Aquihabitans sp. G128]QXC62117.1 hypothetical protein KSP35_04720 [Aquihabitans sp. G128]
MRRNAESLLVLAGAEPPRRRGRPAPLANVVRAALAEVEDFGRIELLSFDEILVASNAAADLAHLLSELMENATNFSPPETRVEVVGHRTKADGYVISVTDHGIGMSSEQILDANESLAKPPLVGLALSRSLGFIVVGRLSGRHGIAVRMMPSPSGGVTAVVSIPPSLVTDALAAGAGPVGPSLVEVPGRLKPVLEPTLSAPQTGDLAPLAFTPYGAESAGPSPATFAEAVPSGPAFDAGLDALVGESAAPPVVALSGPSSSEAGAQHANGLPTRRLTASPPPPREPIGVAGGPMAFTPPPAAPAAPAPESPAPAFDDRPTPLFARNVEPSTATPEPPSTGPVDPEPASHAAPTAPEALPEPIAFGATAASGVQAPASARLDGPPPALPPLPSRAPSARPGAGESEAPRGGQQAVLPRRRRPAAALRPQRRAGPGRHRRRPTPPVRQQRPARRAQPLRRRGPAPGPPRRPVDPCRTGRPVVDRRRQRTSARRRYRSAHADGSGPGPPHPAPGARRRRPGHPGSRRRTRRERHPALARRGPQPPVALPRRATASTHRGAGHRRRFRREGYP